MLLAIDGHCTLQLSVRGKNKKERLGSIFKSVTQSADELLLSSQKDVDEFFEQQRTFLMEYHTRIKEATTRGDRMTRNHKGLSSFIALGRYHVMLLLYTLRSLCTSLTKSEKE